MTQQILNGDGPRCRHQLDFRAALHSDFQVGEFG